MPPTAPRHTPSAQPAGASLDQRLSHPAAATPAAPLVSVSPAAPMPTAPPAAPVVPAVTPLALGDRRRNLSEVVLTGCAGGVGLGLDDQVQ